MDKLNKFFGSIFYLLLVYIISILSWTFHGEVIGYSLLLVIALVILVLKLNSLYLMPIIFDGMFLCRTYTSMAGVPKILYVAGILLIILLLIYMARVKPDIKKPKLKLGLLAISISSLISLVKLDTGGDELRYWFSLVPFVYFFVYLFFGSTSTKTKNFNKTVYTAYALIGLGMLLSSELLIQGFTESGFTNKIIHLGWGGANTAAIYINMAIIMCFYLLTYYKKIYSYFILCICICFFSAIIFITQSRTGYLAYLICLIPCAVMVIIKSQNKKQLFYVIATFAFAGIMVCDLYSEVIINYFDLAFRIGLDDNGRTEMWIDAINKFYQSPLIGNGFFSVDIMGGSPDPNRLAVLHNILIQCLFSFGIIGLAALLFHYYEKYKMLLSNLTEFNIFFIILSISGFIHGMLDNTYYMGVYMTVVCILFTVCENDKSPIELDLKVLNINKKEELTNKNV